MILLFNYISQRQYGHLSLPSPQNSLWGFNSVGVVSCCSFLRGLSLSCLLPPFQKRGPILVPFLLPLLMWARTYFVPLLSSQLGFLRMNPLNVINLPS